jgi:hypothetical protein
VGIWPQKPISRCGRPPLGPLFRPCQNFTAKSAATRCHPVYSFPSPFPLHQQPSKPFAPTRNLYYRGTVITAPRRTANACYPNWSAAPFLPRDCSRLAGATHKIFDFSVPFRLVYLNITTSTNFGCSEIFRKRRLGFVPPAAHLHHISQFLIF